MIAVQIRSNRSGFSEIPVDNMGEAKTPRRRRAVGSAVWYGCCYRSWVSMNSGGGWVDAFHKEEEFFLHSRSRRPGDFEGGVLELGNRGEGCVTGLLSVLLPPLTTPQTICRRPSRRRSRRPTATSSCSS